MLFVSKNYSLEKVAFMNSSCFIIKYNFVQDYSKRRFFRKGFEPEVHGNLTRLSARNEIGRGFCL